MVVLGGMMRPYCNTDVIGATSDHLRNVKNERIYLILFLEFLNF